MKLRNHIQFDWAIKNKLSSEANLGILEGFLSELLKEDVKIRKILGDESNKETVGNKLNRVDILVKDSKGQLIIAEIQNIRKYDYFYKFLYYTARPNTEHMGKGMVYPDVKKVITVSMVYFDLGQGRDYIYHGNTIFEGIHHHDTLELSQKQQKMFNRETVSAIYPDHFIIKVNDFDGTARDNLDQWIYFLKNSEIKEEFNAKGLAEAREKLKEINLPDKELAAYLHHLEELRFEASLAATVKFDLEYAEQEGYKEGVKIGKALVVSALKEKGIATDIIMETSGLSKEEIENL